jgi:carboxylesterase type B
LDKKPWEGVLDGTIDGPPCIQLNQFNESQVVGSEDCLTLNVYTPELPSTGNDRLRPVLVYIHGGRWLVGTASSKAYSPIYLMDQDIVVVSIQYRVGALGFLR